jgi:hypothetical protein
VRVLLRVLDARSFLRFLENLVPTVVLLGHPRVRKKILHPQPLARSVAGEGQGEQIETQSDYHNLAFF